MEQPKEQPKTEETQAPAEAPKEAEKEAPADAPKANEKTISVVQLEVVGTVHGLRMTECGALLMRRGTRLAATNELADKLVETYTGNLKVVGKPAQVAESKMEGKAWRIVAASPIDTKNAPSTSTKGAATNKSMAGKAPTKGK